MAGVSNPLEVVPTDYRGIVFVGKVVDNNDPDKCERVRVRVPELHDSTVSDDMLPWARPRRVDCIGGTSTAGFFGVPVIGSLVDIELQNGDVHFPVYTGVIRCVTNLIEDANTNYPNRYGFVDETGNKFIIDRKDGTVDFIHSSGAMYMKIAEDGSIVFKAPRIDVGIEGSEPMVMGNQLANWFVNTLKTWLDGHKHICASPGSPSGPASAAPTGPFTVGDGEAGGSVYSTRNTTQA